MATAQQQPNRQQDQELRRARYSDERYGRNLEHEFKKLGKPPKEEFKNLMTIAVVADVSDFFMWLGWLTGVGGPLGIAVELVFDIWFYSKVGQRANKTKSMQDFSKKVGRVQATLRRQQARVLKLGRRLTRNSPAARRSLNRLALRFSRFRAVIGTALDKIPVIELLPFRIWAVRKAREEYAKQYEATLAEILALQRQRAEIYSTIQHPVPANDELDTPPQGPPPGEPAPIPVTRSLPRVA